eukprot:4431261-Prymnesium_polylepis.3
MVCPSATLREKQLARRVDFAPFVGSTEDIKIANSVQIESLQLLDFGLAEVRTSDARSTRLVETHRVHEVQQDLGQQLVRGSHRKGARLGGPCAAERCEDIRPHRPTVRFLPGFAGTHGTADLCVPLRKR